MAIPKAFPFLVFAAFGIIGTTLPPIAGAALAAETSVRLQSHNPVRIRDLLDGYAKNDPAQTIDGILSIPGNGDDVPAMLIMHGSGGIGQRGADYQQLLNFMGIATLRIDSFGPRGVRMTVDDQTKVSTLSMVADAFAGLKYLGEHPRIDPDRIGIMGFSKGGSVSHFTAFEPIRAAAGVGDLRFALHIPFYRACLYDVEMALTGAPVRELIGGADNYTGVDICRSHAERQKNASADYEVIVYPGAHHGFDGTRPPRRCQSCIAVPTCDVRVIPSGAVIDKPSGREITLQNFRDVLRPCVRRNPTVGADADAKRKARAFLKGYLTEMFGL